jgi:hypothetical protein
MTKVTYDLRPVDSTNVIQTRNRIRLSAFLNIFGVLLYLTINPVLVGVHASWIHLIHMVSEPLIIFTTVADNSGFAFAAMVMAIVEIVIDLAITALNFISVMRCLGEPSASCFDRLYEKGFLLFLAGWFVLFNLISATQLSQLKSQLEDKDTQEKFNREKQKLEKDVPSWNSALVYSNKIRVINLFLFLFDLLYIILVVSLVNEAPMLILGSIHVYLDPYCYFSINKSMEAGVYNMVRIAFVLSAICNIISLILLVQLSLDGIGKILCTMITLMYLVTDLIQILYSSKVVSVIEMQKKYKNSL